MPPAAPTPASPAPVALVTIGSAGDLFPFIGLALALRARGHAVTLIAPDLHEPFVREAGLDFAPLRTTDHDRAVLDHPDLWHPRKGFGLVWHATRPAVAQVPALVAASGAAIVVAHPLALPEADLCRTARPGLRIAAAYLAPSNLASAHDALLGPLALPRWIGPGVRRWLLRRAFALAIDPVTLPALNDARRRHGLAPVLRFADYMYTVADVSLMLFPPWFGPPRPDWPQPHAAGDFPLYDPRPGAGLSPALQRFLDAGDAPLAFTPGTGNRQAARYFAEAARAAQQLGRRAVFLTLHREQLPAVLPDTILWQEFVHLPSLLPRVGALVHHGGIGTTAEALRAGVPQLVVPLAHDQFDNAWRVRELGVGDSVAAPRANAQAMAARLAPLLDSSAVRARCAEHAARLAGGPDLDGLCRAVADLQNRD